jgi:exosortase family protein XrtF
MEKTKKHKGYAQLQSFILIALARYLSWFMFYNLWLEKDGRLDEWLTEETARASSLVLRGLGYDSSHQKLQGSSAILKDGHTVLKIAHVCNGLVLYVLFTGFVISFPGRWQQKLWFILAGMVAIFVINVLRAAVLTLIKVYAPDALDFNHRYTFLIIMYGAIFGLWMLWVQRFSPLSQLKTRS